MPSAQRVNAGEEITPDWWSQSLHDLSQPLTALECGLAIAMMSGNEQYGPDAKEMEEAIRSGLVQCERMMRQVREMQHRLQWTE